MKAEELDKGQKIAHTPGHHFDRQKHRWVDDEEMDAGSAHRIQALEADADRHGADVSEQVSKAYKGPAVAAYHQHVEDFIDQYAGDEFENLSMMDAQGKFVGGRQSFHKHGSVGRSKEQSELAQRGIDGGRVFVSGGSGEDAEHVKYEWTESTSVYTVIHNHPDDGGSVWWGDVIPTWEIGARRVIAVTSTDVYVLEAGPNGWGEMEKARDIWEKAEARIFLESVIAGEMVQGREEVNARLKAATANLAERMGWFYADIPVKEGIIQWPQ
ncbi:MAG: hypothetical protein JRC86_08725 [Deltaproteobacteria bacterium]|nr:hypothetical protein [Deltaproteobacteria bacterium]